MSLSSSGQVSPNWWVNPANDVDYLVAVQTPDYQMDSEEALMNTPVHYGTRARRRCSSNLAQMERGHTASVVNHYNVQPVYDVYANVQDRDLGGFLERRRKGGGRVQIETARRELLRNARASGDHAGFVHGHGLRPGVRDPAGVLPDGGEFPIVDGSVHHPDGGAGRAGRNPADAVFHAHDDQCSGADGRYHEHWRGHGEQHSAGHFRQRFAARRHGRDDRRV